MESVTGRLKSLKIPSRVTEREGKERRRKGGQAKKGEERRKQRQRTDQCAVDGRTIRACKKGNKEKRQVHTRDNDWKDNFLFTESIG